MILEQFRLDGKVALVTGGSRGLGAAMTRALAEAGADIITLQRTEPPAELTNRLSELGRRFLSLTLDISDEHAAQAALEAALSTFGRVDILVNNAGIQRRAPVLDFSLEDWDNIIDVNLRAVFVFSQVFGRHMTQQGAGKIINIASLLAFQGGFNIPAYAASKHGVAGITQAFCNELASQGVNVNAIAPGYIATDLNVALREDPIRERQISERIPAGRWGTANDLAGAVVFLASPASDYMHGHVLSVDGGWLAR